MARHADPNAKDALIAAARREFARRGLRGARVEDITSACGLSKGAFYLHFPSKEDLFGGLVKDFLDGLTSFTEQRQREMAAFIEKHGSPTRRDVEKRTPRYHRFLEIEMREDLEILELMWAHRDVLDVLVRGSQGTRFEGAVWAMTGREVERIQENVERFKGNHACRTDIPTEIFASMIVGTYLLLGMRMSRMTEKPDLAEWARSLNLLIREGSAPGEETHPQSKKSRARSIS